MSKLKTIFYLFFPLLIGSLAGVIIKDAIDYSTLLKPPLAPPKIIFPIAWTILYLLMGLSFYLLNKENEVTKPITNTYYLQLFFNFFWTIIFFSLKWRLLAIFWILILDFLVIYLLYQLRNKNKLAFSLFIPYLIWLLFATYLNIGIYILN